MTPLTRHRDQISLGVGSGDGEVGGAALLDASSGSIVTAPEVAK